MLKIYTDHNFLNADNRRIIFPLLFDLVYVPNEKTKSNFSFTDSILDADIAIFPIDIISFLKSDKKDFLKQWLDKMTARNIPIIVYAAGDFGCSLDKPNVVTFRFAGFNSKVTSSTEIMPSFIEDPYDKILEEDFYVIQKKAKPTIGFVGNANGSLLKICKEFGHFVKRNLLNLWNKSPEDFCSFYPSSYERHKILQIMVKEDRIESNFIFRKKYRARNKNFDDRQKTTLEFFKNIQDNLYVFCLRGNGNFSVRFYETLIMGRIPVLVDTDVRLPLSDEINWSKHCLLVSEDSIVTDLIQFHSSKTDAELKEIQLSNRKLMLDKLNRIDYFIHIKEKMKIK